MPIEHTVHTFIGESGCGITKVGDSGGCIPAIGAWACDSSGSIGAVRGSGGCSVGMVMFPV